MRNSDIIAKHAGVMHYEKLPPHLQAALFAIEPSICGDLQYRPCTVTLKNGDVSDIVYVVPADPYIRQWGVWPENDRGKKSVRIEDVASIEESPIRLPPKFANELYNAGESGMGYTIFTVVFSDGERHAYSAGGAVDFIRYPSGKGPANVVGVLPHVGRNNQNISQVPPYYWCLYSS
jgi:hypothetical protein